jgi:deazaflavin-dependent oxidoreductase (nitroreductase family)
MRTAEQVKAPPKTPGWLNRLMGGLLRSPFSRLVDRGIMLLTVFGRRTGRAYTFPVQYVEDGRSLWIYSGAGEEKTWWRNLRPGGPVEVLLRRRKHRGRGVVFTYADQPEMVEEGLRRYSERFPGMAKRMGLSLGDRKAFAEAAARSVTVRIDLED